MKTFIFLSLAFLSIYQSSAQCWNLVWADEFEGTSLDTSKWNYLTGGGGWGNNELQHYTARPENVNVSGGYLHIVARDEDYLGNAYTSGRIRSLGKGDWRYGKVEARMKLVSGQGLWPAFWMMPSEALTPPYEYGEIDIMELLGQMPAKTYGTVHAGTADDFHSSSSEYTLPSGNFAQNFHVFKIEWEPTTIRFYVDDVLFATKTASDLSGFWPFDVGYHVILNLAVGGGWPGPPNANTVFPNEIQVDYVRVSQQLEDIRISGNAQVQPNACNQLYQLPSIPGTTYTWTATGGAIANGQGTASISVDWANSSGSISAEITNACGTHLYSFPVTVTPNLLYNGGYEQGFLKWETREHVSAQANFQIVTNNVPEGAKAAKVTVTALDSEPWTIQLAQTDIPLQTGFTYTLTFRAKAGNGANFFSAAFIHYTNYEYYAGSDFDLTNTWQEYSMQFTVPSNTTAMLNFDLAYSLGTYFFDDVRLIRNPPVISGPPQVCMGANNSYSTPFLAGAAYAWTVNGGTILSGQGTNAIVVQWTTAIAGNVAVTVDYP